MGEDDGNDDSGGIETLARLLRIDADSDAGQLLLAALRLQRIMDASLNAETEAEAEMGRDDTGDTGAEDSSEGEAEATNDEEVDMEIDE